MKNHMEMTGNGNAEMQFCGSIESIGFLNETSGCNDMNQIESVSVWSFLWKDSAASSVFFGFSVGSPSRQINANLMAIKAKHYQSPPRNAWWFLGSPQNIAYMGVSEHGMYP